MNPHTKLIDLADGCLNGASNAGAIIRSFGPAIESLSRGSVRDNPAVKCILGHLSYLCGESLGPTYEALHGYDAWKAAVTAPPATAAATPQPQLLAA